MATKKATVQQIRDKYNQWVADRKMAWKREDVATLAAMDTIDGILVEQEQRRKRRFKDMGLPAGAGE